MRIWFDSDGEETKTIWKLHRIVDNKLLTPEQTEALERDIDAIIDKYVQSVILSQGAKLQKPKEFKTGDIITAHGDDTYFVQSSEPELVLMVDDDGAPAYGYRWRWCGEDRFTVMNADDVKDSTPEQAKEWFDQMEGWYDDPDTNEEYQVDKMFYERWLSNVESTMR